MKQSSEATQTIKIRVKTHQRLKVLAALRRESMMDTIDRLVEQDLQRVQQEQQQKESK